MASRSSRLSAEIRRVAAVITRSGRSTRPATHQPTTTDSAAITPSAISDPSRNWCEMAAWAWSADDGTGWTLPSRAVAAGATEVADPTPLVMASIRAADSTNRTQYKAVSRIRTVRHRRGRCISPSMAA